MKRFLCVFGLTLVATLALVLGAYHMANPGHDIYNMQADDVLAPKRQAEIAQVMAAFRTCLKTLCALSSFLVVTFSSELRYEFGISSRPRFAVAARRSTGIRDTRPSQCE